MSLGYTRDSFVPLTPVATTSFVLVAKNLTSYEQFLNHSTTNPIKLGFWHEPTSRVMKRWAELTNINVDFIPYTGSTPQLDDLEAGKIEFAFDTWVAATARPVHILAVLDKEGKQDNLPCISELHPELNIDNWYSICANSNMDPEFARQLAEVLSKGLEDPKYQERIKQLNFRAWNGTAEDVAKKQQKTIDFYKNFG
jgi:tripartite-type tricarboxylate transporter receptor subunit TctC